MFHCSPMTRMEGSPDVYANGIKVSRQGDKNTEHMLPTANPCPTHSAGITMGSTTVKVNGKGCGRVGDAITACMSVAMGSPNVYAGG